MTRRQSEVPSSPNAVRVRQEPAAVRTPTRRSVNPHDTNVQTVIPVRMDTQPPSLSVVGPTVATTSRSSIQAATQRTKTVKKTVGTASTASEPVVQVFATSSVSPRPTTARKGPAKTVSSPTADQPSGPPLSNMRPTTARKGPARVTGTSSADQTQDEASQSKRPTTARKGPVKSGVSPGDDCTRTSVGTHIPTHSSRPVLIGKSQGKTTTDINNVTTRVRSGAVKVVDNAAATVRSERTSEFVTSTKQKVVGKKMLGNSNSPA